MVVSFQELVREAITRDQALGTGSGKVAARFGDIVNRALAAKDANSLARVQGGINQQTARTSAAAQQGFANDPAAAARELGIAPPPGQAGGGGFDPNLPGGGIPSKVTIDRGNTRTEFTDKTLNEQNLFQLYREEKKSIDDANNEIRASNSIRGPADQAPLLQTPTWEEFKVEAGFSFSEAQQGNRVENMTDAQVLEAAGYTEEDVLHSIQSEDALSDEFAIIDQQTGQKRAPNQAEFMLLLRSYLAENQGS